MDVFHYLIALALIELDGKRAMPLGGKSLKEPIPLGTLPSNKAEKVSLELLLRLMELTDRGDLKKAAGNRSLLLVKIPMEPMQDKLPGIKSHWLETGNTDEFLAELKSLSQGLWSISFKRYEGICFNEISEA